MQVVPVDQDEYEQATRDWTHFHVFQTAAWGRVKASSGWKPVWFILWDGSVARAGCMCLTRHVHGLLLIYVPKGPSIRDVNQMTPIYVRESLRAVKRLMRRRAAFCKVVADWSSASEIIPGVLRSEGFQPSKAPISHRVTSVVDLDRTAEDIYQGFEPRTRYAIRKAEKEGVTVRIGGQELLEPFYRLYQSSMGRAGLAARSIEELKRCIEEDLAHIFVAGADGDVTSGALVVKKHPRLWYLYGGSSRNVRYSGAELLHWNIILWAKSLGFRHYDLQGFPIGARQGGPLYGVYLFKRGFGGQTVHLPGEFDLWHPRVLQYPGNMYLASSVGSDGNQ